MDRTFACPECGNELQLKGLTPGREVRCGWCSTFVEVPFLPRSPGKPRFRGQARRPAWVPWAWGGLALAGVLIVILGTRHSIRVHERRKVEANLAELTTTAEDAEKAGHLDQAIIDYDTAIQATRAADGPKSQRADDLRQHRDQIAKRFVQTKLAAIAARLAHDPRAVVADGQALLDRVRHDRAVKDLEGEVQDLIVRARSQQAEFDLATAHRARDAGKDADALALCEQTAQAVGYLDSRTGARLMQDADALVAEIVARRGAVVEPVHGEFTLGSSEDSDGLLHPLVAEALRKHGYIPRPASSAWLSVWDEHAPYHVSLNIVEFWGSHYMHSKNRTSGFRIRMNLSRNGTPLWSVGPFSVRTSNPLPNLPAYQASRLELEGSRQRPEIERLLYDEGHTRMREAIVQRLHNLPEISATGQ
jgi:hypothetical protein